MPIWLQDVDSLSSFHFWMQLLSIIGVFTSMVFISMLWRNGNRMIDHLLEREHQASRRIKAVERAAEEIRKELLSTQQDHDIVDQQRRLAEMDVDALRREMEATRSRYTKAEDALRERIDELKDMNLTQTASLNQTTRAVSDVIEPRQRDMLKKLLGSGPKGEVDIVSVMDDEASHQAAQEMKAIFDSQDWTTQGIIQSAFSNAPEGIVLILHSKQTAPSYAKFLQRTLMTAGFPVSAQISAKYREWSISMVIGRLD